MNKLPISTGKWGPIKDDLNANFDNLYGGAGSRTAGNLVALAGDSISQHNIFAAVGKMSKWSRGFLNWAEFYSHGIFSCPNWFDSTEYESYYPDGTPGTRYFFGLNYGVSGNKSDEIAARVNDIIERADCDIVVVLMSTNDIDEISGEAVHGFTQSVCNPLLAAGKKVILMPIPIRGITGLNSWAIGSDERKKLLWTATKRAKYCEVTRGLIFHDINKRLMNSSTGAPFQYFLDDNLHFAPPCAEATGEDLAQLFATMLPPAQPRVRSQDDVYDATLNPFGNIMPNPLCLGTSGTVGTNCSGPVCDDMRMEISGITTNNATVVCSKEASTDNGGDWQVFTFTPGATATLFLFRPSASSNINHSFAAGDWLQGSFEVETNDFNGFDGITYYVQDNGSGGLKNYAMEPHKASNGPPATYYPLAPKARKGLMLINAFQLVSGSTSVRPRAEILIASTNGANNGTGVAATGTGILKIRRYELRKVEDPRVAVNYTPA